MKIRHLIYPAIYLALIGHAWAVCPTFTPTTAANIKDVKTVLDNYNCYLNSDASEYVLDFSNNSYNNTGQFEPNTKFPLTVNNISGKLVRIIGLKLYYNTDKDAVSPYITFSGAKIAMQDSAFTGPGTTGTAIQVNGTATIESTTITNFASGINVAKDASVKLVKNTFTITDAANAVVFDTSVTSPADSTLLGKKVDESDPTNPKAISATGKLNLDSCAGSVEMYFRSVTDKPLSYTSATCTVSTLLDKDITLKFADNTEQIIFSGSCVFTCENFSEAPSTWVAFVYTSADSKTYPFAPMPIMKFSELPDYFVPLVGEQTTGTSGAGGTTIVVIDNTGGQTTTGGDTSGTGNIKAGDGDDLLVDGANKESGDPDNTDSQAKAQADVVGQGSACSVNPIASAPTLEGIFLQLFFLFSGVPVLSVVRKRCRRS